jgi:hypothetical protein
MSKVRAVYYYDEMIVEVIYGQDPDNNGNDIWGFYQLDEGNESDLNGDQVWYVDNDPVPTYEIVYENIVKPNLQTASE